MYVLSSLNHISKLSNLALVISLYVLIGVMAIAAIACGAFAKHRLRNHPKWISVPQPKFAFIQLGNFFLMLIVFIPFLFWAGCSLKQNLTDCAINSNAEDVRTMSRIRNECPRLNTYEHPELAKQYSNDKSDYQGNVANGFTSITPQRPKTWQYF